MKRNHALFTIGTLIFLLAGISLPVLRAQDPENDTLLYRETFDDASEWELEPGWQVIQQDDGNWVLVGEDHQWARLPAPMVSGDFRFLLRLQLLQGRIHLIYSNNRIGRYFIGFHAGGSDLNKQYWPDTFQEGLMTSAASHTLGNWHQIEIESVASRVRFWVDGVLEWEYSDPEPLAGGAFAFETLDDSVAYIDDVTLYGSAPSVAPVGIQNLAWVRTGGPLGGLGYDIRVRPDNPNVMFVTDAWAGIFMSRDAGETWMPSNAGITVRTGESGDAIPIFCATIDPHNPDIIWAGTQNTRGIFKSMDGGLSWTQMNNGVEEAPGITFRGFTVDPQSSDVVYAAAEISSWVWAGAERPGREFDMTRGVVYRTTDGGLNWTAIWRGDNLARYVWIDPRNSNVLYISTGIFDREAANSDPQARQPGGVGIVKSTDGGQTWNPSNNGLNNLYVGSLFMHPENPDILLAGAGNIQYHEGGGVYLSTDGGTSWRQTLSEDIIQSVEFALSDPNIAYAGNSGAIYRSEDGGQSWQRVSGGSEDGWGSPGVRAGFPIDFQVDPSNPDRLFANNYGGGNFLSLDGGHTWTVASAGYTGAQVRDITVDPAISSTVFAAGRSGIFVSVDGGDTWTGLNNPPQANMEWYAVAVDPANSQHILAANNWSAAIVESWNGGQKWKIVSSPVQHGISWRVITFAHSDPSTVYAGTSAFYSAGTFDDRMPAAGIYVSHDGGANWSAANDANSQDGNITGLAVAPDNPAVVYATTGNHGVLRSIDGGNNWERLSLPVTSSTALSVVVHPVDPLVVYAGLASVRAVRVLAA